MQKFIIATRQTLKTRKNTKNEITNYRQDIKKQKKQFEDASVSKATKRDKAIMIERLIESLKKLMVRLLIVEGRKNNILSYF